jgi:hypothetical protein
MLSVEMREPALSDSRIPDATLLRLNGGREQARALVQLKSDLHELHPIATKPASIRTKLLT